ncbi:GDP-L-fucose synthase [Tamlana sp. 2_MG-2023]|uniref:GDP-L-fucose synthase family protein n=1 Tax=unclassified Tamlana TaxID=2614803 RepID=UPI0026E4872F|nr:MULTISPECIES: GDP-L-fucose synthase [unclassified Tamlana]MDO6760234.1 GDP-L-fucose synthase [Tamlana sp. 2_MG-2023]MDO6790068.1 GDP-L-fucose synthase [Tamlana sp. 1_MG-2023]
MKIYIAGHRGMVGSAVWRALEKDGYTNLIGKTSSELDLRDQVAVTEFIKKEKPQVIIDAAARVGGILANSQFPYQFLMENLQIQNNLIDAAHKHDVKKFVFLGSSCIYPKFAPQPLKEDYLLTDSLEPTNEWYAIAKITGVKACQAIRNQYKKDFVSLMPTNLYGPNDNFDLKSSHVLPAMLRKFHEAKGQRSTVNSQKSEVNSQKSIVKGQKESKVNCQQSTVNIQDKAVTLWGSGTPMREFLHVDDMAQAVVHAVNNVLPEYLYNVGTGKDITIKTLAETIQKVVGHEGDIIWDSDKPDGTPRKLMDSSKLNQLGWQATTSLEDGIASTYKWFLENVDDYKKVKI